MPDDPLRSVLLDFLYELREENIELMIGGGYGLFLKQEHLARSGHARTLLPQRKWPQARATNDIDLLLRPEIVVDPGHMSALRETLGRLRFEAVEGAKYYQFEKPLGSGTVRFDILTGPSSQFAIDGIYEWIHDAFAPVTAVAFMRTRSRKRSPMRKKRFALR